MTYSRTARRGPFRRTALAKRLRLALEAAYPNVGGFDVGRMLGRLVIVVRSIEWSTASPRHQRQCAMDVAMTAQRHLTDGGWWSRRLAGSATVVVLEGAETYDDCSVNFSAEWVVLPGALLASTPGSQMLGGR